MLTIFIKCNDLNNDRERGHSSGKACRACTNEHNGFRH